MEQGEFITSESEVKVKFEEEIRQKIVHETDGVQCMKYS